MEFDHTLLWAVVLPAALWVWYWHRRSVAGLRPAAAWAGLVANVLALTALATALTGPHFTRWRDAPPEVTVLIDASQSMPAEALAWGLERANVLASSAKSVRIGAFAGATRWFEGPISPDALRPELPDRTDIGRAIESALLARAGTHDALGDVAGTTPSFVVITDGNDTASGAVEAAQAAARAGITTHVLVPPVEPDPEVFVGTLDVPDEVVRGRTFGVLAEVVSSRPGRVDCTLDSQPPGLQRQGSVDVTAGMASIRWSDLPVPDTATVSFEVRVACRPQEPAMDTLTQNNARTGIVRIAGRIRAWCLDQPGSGCAELSRILMGAVDVALIGAERVSASVSPEELPDILVVGNAPLGMVEGLADAMKGLEQRGTSLLFLGGKSALSLVDLAGTAIERDLLPVFLQRVPRNKSGRVVLFVLDRSGSMGSANKIAIVREAAIAAAKALPIDTRLGILAFDSATYVLARPEPIGDGTGVVTALASLTSGGGTNIYKALQAAQTQFLTATASEKIAILMTDGKSSTTGMVELAQSMARQGMQVSTIAVGLGADREMLARISEITGGRHYFARGLDAVPRLMLSEARDMNREPVQKGSFRVRPSAHALARRVFTAVDEARLPPVTAHLLTFPRAEGMILSQTERGDPLMAIRRLRGASSAVFTPGLEPGWTDQLLKGAQAPRLLLNLFETLVQEGAGQNTRFDFDIVGDDLVLSADLLDPSGLPIDGAVASAQVIEPDGQTRTILLPPLGLGRYEARVVAFGEGERPETATGTYRATLTMQVGEAGQTPLQRFASYAFPDELSRFTPNRDLAARIAAAGQGKLDPTPAEVLQATRQVPERVSLAHYPILASLAFFLIGIWLRKTL